LGLRSSGFIACCFWFVSKGPPKKEKENKDKDKEQKDNPKK
jgi:hypothetical protein